MSHKIPWDDMDPQPPVTEMWDNIKWETDSAYLMADDGEQEGTWLPKSQVKVRKLSRGYEVEMPYWLAERKGLI